MTALGIRYLMGFAVSSDTTRQKPEFPPHPGRVFMAMAAAHFETQGRVEERRALEWLQSQSEAPHLQVREFAYRRSSQPRVALETYVPVNDKHGGILQRSRQPRSFPTVRLFDEKVYLVWNSDGPDEIRHALEGLCAKVTRIGHSSSLVQMWLLAKEEQVQPTLVADNQSSDRQLRVAGPGTLEYLKQSFSAGKYPRLDVWSGYRLTLKEAARPTPGPFDPNLIVLQKFEGRSLGLESTLQLTSALRNAAMKALPPGECPEWLSGHQADGTPTREPHAAFFPLPFVDARWADGHIVGLAIAVPSGIGAEKVKLVLGPLLFNPDSGEEREIILWRNNVWRWQLSRETRDRPPTALRNRTWTRPSRAWASVTPVVLHHYPKQNRERDVERILFEAFESAHLPRPKAISARPTSPLEGVGHARSVPEFNEGGEALCRYQTHVVVEFEHPIEGPVLVGRGRFRGYGLFKPVKSEGRGDE